MTKSILLIIFYVIAFISTGTTAWDWVEPHSFGRAILFLIVWAILGTVAKFILAFIAKAMFE